MRNAIIGIVIGTVVGVVIGATLLAPKLNNNSIAQAEVPIEHLTPPALADAVPTVDGPAVSWNMASAFAGSMPQIGTLGRRIEQEIWRVSDGQMEIVFHDPGTLVPVADIFDAVSSGAVDAAFTSPRMWQAKVPALQLFGSVPFGPDPSEYLAWIYFGGGRELYEEIYKRHNIHSVFCGMLVPEAAGWFRDQVTTVDDLQGLKVRADGLEASVFKKLGAIPQSLNDGELFAALESGAIDGADFAMPSPDMQLGLQEMAKHSYFPVWQQPATLYEMMVNLDKWNALSPTAQARVETVCGDNVRYGLAQGEAIQFAALKKLSASGVKIHRWPREVVSAFETAWNQVAAENAAEDEDFKKVWNSLSAFRRDYSIWREIGQP